MIDAEVSEGGPPSAVPCDTPAGASVAPPVKRVESEPPTTIEACPAPDRVLRLPLGKALGFTPSATLMKSAGLDLIRLVVPAGMLIPPHRAAGEVTVQCVEGHVAVEHDGRAIELRPGDLLHLCPGEMHAVRGITDSSVLVTRIRPHVSYPAESPAQ